LNRPRFHFEGNKIFPPKRELNRPRSRRWLEFFPVALLNNWQSVVYLTPMTSRLGKKQTWTNRHKKQVDPKKSFRYFLNRFCRKKDSGWLDLGKFCLLCDCFHWAAFIKLQK
jgi:hypothetical protein